MFDVGWPELLVIAIVLIVVVGPEDLPRMLRAFGKATARMRSMAGEFRTQFDEALKEADLDDVRKTISDAQKLNPTKSLREAMNPLRQVGEDIRSGLNDAVKPGSITKPEETLTTTDAAKSSMDIGSPATGLNGGAEAAAASDETAKMAPAKRAPRLRKPAGVKAAPAAGSSRKAKASASGNGIVSETPAPAPKPARSKPAAKTTAARKSSGVTKTATKTAGSASAGAAAPARSGNGAVASAPRKASRKPAASTARAKAAKKAAPRKGADEADT